MSEIEKEGTQKKRKLGITTVVDRIMIRAGYKPAEARKIWVKMDRWQSVERKEVLFTLNLDWVKRQGLMFLNEYTNRAE